MGGSSCIHSVNRWSAGQLKQCALKLYVLSFFQLFLKARWAFTCNLHPKMLLESLSATTQNMSLLISRNTYQAAPKQFLTFWVALCFPDIAQPTGYRRERLGTRLLISVNLQRRCYGVMGIPIPKPLVKWTFPSLITLAIWVRVRVKVTGDAHITGVLRMGMPKTRGCPYHCDTATSEMRTGMEPKSVPQLFLG